MLGRLGLHTGCYQWCRGTEQGHRLPLHVGPHQGAVGIVVLQEGYQCCRDAEYLLGRDVHEIYLFPHFAQVIASQSGLNPFIGKLVVFV